MTTALIIAIAAIAPLFLGPLIARAPSRGNAARRGLLSAVAMFGVTAGVGALSGWDGDLHPWLSLLAAGAAAGARYLQPPAVAGLSWVLRGVGRLIPGLGAAPPEDDRK